jgi:putative sterol carrier protein
MTTVFNPDVAGNLTADIQYRVTGSEPGSYYLHIANGECSFHEGDSPAPNLTIHTPSDVWLAISRGELDGQMAFMQGKYRAEGDFSLLMKMSQLFSAG